MHPRLRFTIFLIVSVALHALVIVGIILIKPQTPLTPLITPVTIVNLPKETVKQLPPLNRPTPVPPVPERFIPQKPVPTDAIPVPKKFGTSDDITLPKAKPRTGVLEGEEPGKETGKMGAQQHKETGPLPFLTQNDIDELARKGFPQDKLRGKMLEQETEAYRLYSYERWLFPALTKNMHFPELAAITGLQGNVFVRFEILKDGSLGNIDILKSSGYKILDDEAVRTIRDSAPFQALPPEWNKDRYVVHGVAIFRIYESYMR